MKLLQAFYWNRHSSSIDRDCKARLSNAQRLKAEILNFLQFHVVENLRYISFYFSKTACFLLATISVMMAYKCKIL